MSLLSHLQRLNFHPSHLANFVAAAFALSLFCQKNQIRVKTLPDKNLFTANIRHNLCFSLFLLIALWFKSPFSAICGDWISTLYIWLTLLPRLSLCPYFVKTTATFWQKKPQRDVEWLTSSACGQMTMTLGSINGNRALLKEENQQISHKTCKLFINLSSFF